MKKSDVRLLITSLDVAFALKDIRPISETLIGLYEQKEATLEVLVEEVGTSRLDSIKKVKAEAKLLATHFNPLSRPLQDVSGLGSGYVGIEERLGSPEYHSLGSSTFDRIAKNTRTIK